MVDLETENTVDASKTIKPAIKSRAKDHDLTNPFCQSLEHNIVDEACSSNSRRSCTWSSSIRIPSDHYFEERNSAKNSGPPQRRSQKVDCKWIRKESPSTRTCRLHGTVKGHVFRSSTCSRRFHLRPVRITAFGSQLVRRVVVAPHYLRLTRDSWNCPGHSPKREKPARCRLSDRLDLLVLHKSERDDLHMRERWVLHPNRALRPNSIHLPSCSPSGTVGGGPCTDEDPGEKAVGDTQPRITRMSP